MNEITYQMSPTMELFHEATDKFVRGLMGPIGSGKSVACVWDIFMLAHQQLPNSENIRKTRFAIIRNTYRELVDTTIETFFDWIPEHTGIYLKKDMKFTYKQLLPDNTIVHIEYLFRALDKPDDIKKLLSLELTGAWINEAREIPKAILDMLQGRVGRYPSKRDGAPTWHGVIMDTNPPDSDHWWYKLFEVDCPSNHILFKQPSGTSPEAENLENLVPTYYTNMQAGKDKEWINVYVHGKYGFVQDGKSVWPLYKDDVHHTAEPIVLDPTKPLVVGIDFGLTPAAVFGQLSASGRWLIFDELVTEDMGAKNFGRLLNSHVNANYSDFSIEFYGDPAGDFRAQTDETTPFQILLAEGINAWPTYTNDPIIRLEAVSATLSRMDFAGNTGFVLGPKATILRKAMAGGYKYKRMSVTGAERYMDKPDKGRYSHVADALQYLMVGAGEGGKLIDTGSYGTKLDYSETNRMVV